MSEEERLDLHRRQISKFSNKVIVIVDKDTKLDPGYTSDLFWRLSEAGYPTFAHHAIIDGGDDVSCIVYCEFNTEADAALFKLREL